MKKSFWTLSLAALLLAGCGNKESKNAEEAPVATDTTEVAAETAAAVEETPAAEETKAPEAVEKKEVKATEKKAEVKEEPAKVEDTKSAATAEELNKALNEFEQHVKKCKSVYERTKKKDLTAIAEYPGLISKSKTMVKELKAMKDDMTAEQWARFVALQAQLAQ